MGFLEKIAKTAFRLAGAVESQRTYAAAKNNRLVGDWTTMNLSANQELKYSNRVLRARARQLERDDDYIIGFLKDLQSNVVGANGFQLQIDAKKSNGEKLKDINQRIETEFRAWSRKQNCTVTGQQTWLDVQKLALKTVAVDGEVLIRLVFDKSSPYGLKLQFLDVDWLDEDYNEDKLSNGNRVVMSVELDDFDKPVAYYLTNPRWGHQGIPNTPLIPKHTDRLRIPADQIIHRFVQERIGQTRGVTWLHGAMMRLNMLSGYEEAELVGARVAASQMAFISKNSDISETTSVNAGATIETEVSPGLVMELPAGYSVHEFNPSRPGNNYAIYVKSILRGIAKSLGVSYNSLASDLESTSYSSIRDGSIRERDIWRMIGRWAIDHICQDIYEKWLMFNMTIVPSQVIEQVMYPTWRSRGFDWVDPQKDITADVIAVDRGFKTITEILAERGKDFEEQMELHAYEREYMDKLGLKFNSPDNPEKLLLEQEQIENQAKQAEENAKQAAQQPKAAVAAKGKQ